MGKKKKQYESMPKPLGRAKSTQEESFGLETGKGGDRKPYLHHWVYYCDKKTTIFPIGWCQKSYNRNSLGGGNHKSFLLEKRSS